MKVLTNKIDFAVIISVTRANPNGDPLNGNRPRQTYDSFGEISDVCLKRKIRNRLQDMEEPIFVQSDENRTDEFRSLNERFNAVGLQNVRLEAPEKWFDVRAFGQVFAFKKKGGGKKKKEDDSTEENADAVSVGIRGPVTIQSAFSVEPITSESLQITKSVNLETEKPPEKKGNDTMGMKHRVEKGVYVTYGAMNPQLAKRNGAFSDEDAEKIKQALCSLFVNDASSARPEGTMEVKKVIWWKHSCPSGDYSSAKVHRSLSVKPDGSYTLSNLDGLTPEELDGF